MMPTKGEVEQRLREYIEMRLEQNAERLNAVDQVVLSGENMARLIAECEFWRMKYWDLHEQNL